MRLKHLNDNAKQRWDRLTRPGRQIQETMFACRLTLERLRIGRPIETFLNKVGLVHFLGKRVCTFECYTLEFLSMLENHEGDEDEGPFITFQLNDQAYKISFFDVESAFGWGYEVDDDFLKSGNYNNFVFWYQIIDGCKWHNRCKNSAIPHPALRFVHRLLSMMVFYHGEPNNVTFLNSTVSVYGP